MKMATAVTSLLLPYCKILFHKGGGGGRGARYSAHCFYNSTRLSSDTIIMEEKLYAPSKMQNACDKHAAGTQQDIFDAIFIDENHTLSEKRRKPQKSRVACGSLA